MAQRVVVVGGSSGIGLAAAQHLAAGGHEVVIAGRNEQRLAEALATIDGKADAHQLDATDHEAVAEFFAGLGSIDHVVVTVTGDAGGMGPLAALPMAQLRAGLDQKLVAHAAIVQAALPVLRGDGSITLVSAASSGSAMPGTAGLAAVNGAVEAMVPVLAVELAPLRVNAVSPGVIATAWWNRVDDATRDATFDQVAKTVPVGRVGSAADVGSAIAFLIDNSYTTGVVLRVDGGAQLRPPA